MEENINISLDEMIVKEGSELNEEKEQLYEQEVSKPLSYDSGDAIIPGQSVKLPIATDVEMEKKEANKRLVQQLALNKLEKEQQQFNSMSDKEKIKDYIFQSEYYRNTNAFFEKYHYEMSGEQKRTLKRSIERAWNKGKYKLTEEQKQDILYELNKASKQANNVRQEEKQVNPLENLSTLNSLINKN